MTDAQLKELFDYVNGHLHWRVDVRANKVKGQEAGRISNTGYRQITINGKLYRTHRLVWLYHYGSMPDFIDHINGNITDNRIENLRPATREQNNRNSKTPKTNTSGCKGVSFIKDIKKWRVQVWANGKQKTFGYFEDLELADLVAVMAREKYHGEFANHG